ncbi:PKD domain-containing protein [Methanocaldococcus infernus]|nr:PKD domain-containing protein [Methanocaldococcus infernus]
MKLKYLLISVVLIFLFYTAFGHEVKLTPENVSVNEYEYFNLTLSANTSEKLGGFEDIICFPNALNITKDNIILSNIANSADLKDVSVLNGKVWISLVWFNNQPSGNFTIATLRFKALNDGIYQITQKPKLSDIEGQVLDTTCNSVRVTVKPLNLTIVEIKPINPKLNNNFDVVISIENAKEPVYNITGIIYYPKDLNVVDLNFYYLENNISNVNLNFDNNSIQFSINLNTSKKDFDLMKLTFFTNKEGTYLINATIKVNGHKTTVKPANFPIGKKIPSERFVGFSTFEKNVSYGDKEFIYITAKNIDTNISEIKGKIEYNSTILKISDISTSLNTIEKNWTVKNNSIDFYIKTNGTVSNNFNILSFWVEPIKNENTTTEIKISQIYLFNENGSINVPIRDKIIIHIIPKENNTYMKENNTSLKVFFAIEIIDDFKVNFYSLCNDNNTHYFWTFGDNSNSTSANPSHKYEKEGLYIIKLKVNNSFGETSYDECLLEIKKLRPINITFSNKTIHSNKSNVTIYCNITVKNPFSTKIYGNIQFIDYNDYKPEKTYIPFELLPNETKVFSIPINISKSTQIKGYVEYYMPIKRLIKYVWSFKENIELIKPKEVKFNNYYYNLTLNQLKIIIKINKIRKNYTITKKIEIEENEENFINLIVSLIGFLIGLTSIYLKIHKF